MLKPEVYFLRYAYPCAKDLLGKSLKQEDIDKMRNSVLENSPLPREYLEGIFKNAIKGMKKINASDYWSIETIRAYFWIEHEKNLQHLEKMPMLKERCLVKRGKINEQLKHGFYKVQFTDGKTRNITLELLPEARLGDDVLVHRAHAVEKVYDKVNVYCFGNPHLSSDNLAMRLADKIELDGYTLMKCSSPDMIDTNLRPLVILDVVRNIKDVKIITDVNVLRQFNIVSTHDLDLGYHLNLLHELGELKDFTIIGIPPIAEEQTIEEKVKQTLKELFPVHF